MAWRKNHVSPREIFLKQHIFAVVFFSAMVFLVARQGLAKSTRNVVGKGAWLKMENNFGKA